MHTLRGRVEEDSEDRGDERGDPRGGREKRV